MSNIFVDLTGVNVAFLAFKPNENGGINHSVMQAMDAISDRGVRIVKAIKGINEATAELVKIQERHGIVPADQRFLWLTQKGNIVNLFS